MPKIHLNVDATSLTGSSCMFRWKSQILDGLREPKMSCDVVYGIAVHAFVDEMYQSGDMGRAVAALKKAFAIPKYDKPDKKHMSDIMHCLDTSTSVWRDFCCKEEKFQLLQLNKRQEDGTDKLCAATEINFSLPYYEDDTLSVSLTGTMDKLGKFTNNGIYANGDWKSTSARSDSPFRIKDYFSSYEMSVQLKLYRFALMLMAERYPDSILGQIGATNTGSFIDAIFVRANPRESVFIRGPVTVWTQEQMSEFKLMLDKKIAELAVAVRDNKFDKDGLATGVCQLKFGKCMMWNYCRQTNPAIQELILKKDFIVRQYNPLNFNDL